MPNHKYKSITLRRVTAMLLSFVIALSNLSMVAFAAPGSDPEIILSFTGDPGSPFATNGIACTFKDKNTDDTTLIADAYAGQDYMNLTFSMSLPKEITSGSREFYVKFHSVEAGGAESVLPVAAWTNKVDGAWDGSKKVWDIQIPIKAGAAAVPDVTGSLDLSTMGKLIIHLGQTMYEGANFQTPIAKPMEVKREIPIIHGIPTIQVRSDKMVDGRTQLEDLTFKMNGTELTTSAINSKLHFRAVPHKSGGTSINASLKFSTSDKPSFGADYSDYQFKGTRIAGEVWMNYNGQDYNNWFKEGTQIINIVSGCPDPLKTDFTLEGLKLKTTTAIGVSSVHDLWVHAPYQEMNLDFNVMPKDEFGFETKTGGKLTAVVGPTSVKLKITSEPNPDVVEKLTIKSGVLFDHNVIPTTDAVVSFRFRELKDANPMVILKNFQGFNVSEDVVLDGMRTISLLPTTPEVFKGSVDVEMGGNASTITPKMPAGVTYARAQAGTHNPSAQAAIFITPEMGTLTLNLTQTDSVLDFSDANGNSTKIKLRILKVPQLKFEQLSGAKLVETREGGVYNLNVIGTSAAHAPDWPGIPFTITDGYVTRIGESVALPTNLLQTPMTNVPNFYDIYNVGRNKVGSIKVTGEDLLLNLEEYETVNRKIAQAETLAGNTAGSIAEMKRLVALAKLPAEYTQADLRVYVTKATEAQAVIVNVSDLLNKLRDVKIQRDSKEVGTAPGTYPQASMTKLNVVFDRATALSISANPTKKEVADELFAVEQAWNLFLSEVNTVPGLNTTALQAKITECSAITNADKKYTASSFKKLTDKIAAANVVLADKNSTQLTIDTMVTELTTAKAGLVLETGGGVDPGPGPGPDPGPDPGGDGSGSQPTKDNVQLILPPMLNSTYRVGTGVFPTTVTLRLPIESPGVSAAAFAKVGLTSNSPKVKISPAPEKMSRSARAPANYKEYDVTVSLIDDSVVTVPLNVVKDTSAATPEVLYGKTLTLQAVKQEGVPTDPGKPVDPPKPPPEVITDTWDSDEVIAELQNLKTGGALELPIDTKYRVGADVFRKLRDKRGSLVLYNDSEAYTFVIKNTDVTGVRPSEVINDFSVQISDTYDRDLRKLFGKTGVVLEFGLSKPGFKSTFGVDTELRKKKLYIYSEVAEDEYEFLCTTTSSNRGLVEFKLTNYDMIVISEKRIPNKYVVNYEDLVAQSGTSGTGGATGEVGTGGSTSNTGNLPTIPVTNPNTGGETAQYVYRGEEDAGSVSPLLAILVFVALSGAGTLGIMEILRIRRKNE